MWDQFLDWLQDDTSKPNKQSSGASTSCSAGQKIPFILQKLKFHCCVWNSLPLLHMWTRWIQFTLSHLFSLLPILILPLIATSRSSNWDLPFMFLILHNGQHSCRQYLLMSSLSRRLLLASLSPVGRTASCPTATPMLPQEINKIITIFTVLLSEFTADGGSC